MVVRALRTEGRQVHLFHLSGAGWPYWGRPGGALGWLGAARGGRGAARERLPVGRPGGPPHGQGSNAHKSVIVVILLPFLDFWSNLADLSVFERKNIDKTGGAQNTIF